MSVDGVLNLNKPYGLTSMALVRRLKRLAEVKRVGHGGTLDPIATGVIPVCFGRATRVMEYLVDGSKEYRTVIELGVETDTYDAMGEVTQAGDASNITRDQVAEALLLFSGRIDQVPPMYSALKRQGKRLYELARAGMEVDRAPRAVEVYAIELADWSPPLVTVDVTCGRGFYMRSLAYDLGGELGCGAHLKELVRTRSGPFLVEEALSIEDAEDLISEGDWGRLWAPDVVLEHMRAVVVGRTAEDDIRHGRPLPAQVNGDATGPEERCRVYSADGRFLAIVVIDGSSGMWRPEKVFV